MAVAGGPNIAEDGLVLYLDAANPESYPGSGTTWGDLSGNGNDGALVNGPTFDGGNGGSILVDGLNDSITLGISSGLDNNEFTVCLWYKPQSHSTYGSIINGKLPNGAFSLFWYNNNSISIQYQDNTGLTRVNGGVWIRSNAPLTLLAGTWYHIHIIGNESNQYYRCGVNAIQSQSQFASQFIEAPPVWKLGVGKYSNYDNGYTSNIQIYNRILTSQEILQNYNATKARYGL